MMLMPTLSILMLQCGDKGKICNMIAEMTTGVNEQPIVCRLNDNILAALCSLSNKA